MRGSITPRVDIAFKKIFGVEENKDLLISLINSIVSEEDQVEQVTLLNPYNPRNFRDDKLSILDIKAIGNNGKMFNIEIQISDEADYDKRALYYWARLYTEQLKKSKDYAKLNKAIGIHILNFLSIPGVEKYHNVFEMKERDSNVAYFSDIELHTIELNKFANPSDKTSDELTSLLPHIKTALDRWVTFIAKDHLLDKNKLPKELDKPELHKALDVLDEMNFNDDERENYEAHLKWLMVQANSLKKMQEDSFAEGEQAKAIEIASKLLSAGMDIQQIMQITNLSEDEIKNLR